MFKIKIDPPKLDKQKLLREVYADIERKMKNEINRMKPELQSAVHLEKIRPGEFKLIFDNNEAKAEYERVNGPLSK